VDFRLLTSADYPAWAGLLAVCFERSQDDMERLLLWLRCGHALVAWGAWEGDRLVAQYSCRLASLHLPDCETPLTVGMSINMAVHPAYHGQGLIKHIARPVYEQVAECGGVAGVGFSNAEGVKVDRRSRSYGYRVVGKMVSTLALLSHRRYPSPLELTTEPHIFPDEMPDDSLIRFAQPPGWVCHRFLMHPFRQYAFAQGEAGLVVYRPARIAGLRGASLLGAYGADLPDLLARWAGALRRRGMHFVHALTSPASATLAAVKTIGRSVQPPVSRQPYYLTTRPLREDTPAALFDFAGWDCVGGDIL
jgi:GNAT superfamily N-acetyltransferase